MTTTPTKPNNNPKKIGSRFVRVIPAPQYQNFLQDVAKNKSAFYKYDNKGRRVL